MELVLPWAVLAADNHRLVPRRYGRGLVGAPAYRERKASAELLCRALWRGPMLAVPVEVHGVAYFPDLQKRDAGNYRKLITDALTGIAYVDDSLVWREVWERGPIDRTNPRMVVTVSPLPNPPTDAPHDVVTDALPPAA